MIILNFICPNDLMGLMTGAVRAARLVASTGSSRSGSSQRVVVVRGGGASGGANGGEASERGRGASGSSGDQAGGASGQSLALGDHASSEQQTRPEVIGDQRRAQVAVEGVAIAALINELGVDGERDVQRVGERAHLPGDSACFSNERADHRVAVAWRQTYLGVAVQAVDHLAHHAGQVVEVHVAVHVVLHGLFQRLWTAVAQAQR